MLSSRSRQKWPLAAGLPAVWALVCASTATAGFLYPPEGAPTTDNGFFKPTINYDELHEYSAWSYFYSRAIEKNYPTLYAPYGKDRVANVAAGETSDEYGNIFDAEGKRIVRPVPLSTRWDSPAPEHQGFADGSNPANANNPYYYPRFNPDLTEPNGPIAFWDNRNASITQLEPTAFITSTSNIYSFNAPIRFRLENSPDYSVASGASGILGNVIFQFETWGSIVDFSNIRLVYHDGVEEVSIYAKEAEYLREYGPVGNPGWSGAGSYGNRVSIQWDMSRLKNRLTNEAISSYQIFFESTTSSMSLVGVDLITTDYYKAAIPLAAKWTGGDGNWGESNKWEIYRNGVGEENEGVNLPQANGNIRFANSSEANVELLTDFTLGEMIFESEHDVTVFSQNGAKLISNTGLAVRAGASGKYTVETDWEMTTINFFEIADPDAEVRLAGTLHGSHGIVKTGKGALVLEKNNPFSGSLTLQGGSLTLEGENVNMGTINIISGELIGHKGNASFGSQANISLGADGPSYEHVNPAGSAIWQVGNQTLSKNLLLARGNIEKRIGAREAETGAIYSGTVNLTPDAQVLTPHANNVKFTAEGANDRLIFSGQIINGTNANTITADGLGTVVYSGVNKTYHNSTIVNAGTLLIESGTSYTGNGHWSVNSGATLNVKGTLAGNGNLTLNGGRITGAGTISRVFTVGAGSVLSPGNSPGTLNSVSQTWAGGGSFLFEMADAETGRGTTGWDFANINGTLSLTATEAVKFTLQIVSLTTSFDAGLVHNFETYEDGSWLFATASGGITGFNADAFAFDLSGFQNLTTGGTWSVSLTTDSRSLVLNYFAGEEPPAAVPEPSTYGLLLMGAAALGWGLRGRMRQRRMAA